MATSAPDAKRTLWLWHYPNPNDLTLLLIEETPKREGKTEYRVLDVWFHQHSAPENEDDWLRFERARDDLNSMTIAALIERRALTPIRGVDELPHWLA